MLFKISNTTPQRKKKLPDSKYTKESQLLGGEYTREWTSWWIGTSIRTGLQKTYDDKYTRESRLPSVLTTVKS
jgi:hypothetical protein